MAQSSLSSFVMRNMECSQRSRRLILRAPGEDRRDAWSREKCLPKRVIGWQRIRQLQDGGATQRVMLLSRAAVPAALRELASRRMHPPLGQRGLVPVHR